MQAALSQADVRRVKIVRARLVGRRWRISFFKTVFARLEEEFGPDVEVRITSFMAANAGMPLTDIDIFVEPTARNRGVVYRIILEALMDARYPPRRLLTVKEAEAAIAAEAGDSRG